MSLFYLTIDKYICNPLFLIVRTIKAELSTTITVIGDDEEEVQDDGCGDYDDDDDDGDGDDDGYIATGSFDEMKIISLGVFEQEIRTHC